MYLLTLALTLTLTQGGVGGGDKDEGWLWASWSYYPKANPHPYHLLHVSDTPCLSGLRAVRVDVCESEKDLERRRCTVIASHVVITLKPRGILEK